MTPARLAEIRRHFNEHHESNPLCDFDDVALELVDLVESMRATMKSLHRRTQKAEGALLKLQGKPVDTWSSPERQQEARERDRMMAAIGRAVRHDER